MSRSSAAVERVHAHIIVRRSMTGGSAGQRPAPPARPDCWRVRRSAAEKKDGRLEELARPTGFEYITQTHYVQYLTETTISDIPRCCPHGARYPRALVLSVDEKTQTLLDPE